MWQQIRDDILARISAGLLKPGDKLESTRELAERYEVASATVRRAVEYLMAVGVLRGHQGRAVYVADPEEGPAVSSSDLKCL